jgi:hypothetical protein
MRTFMSTLAIATIAGGFIAGSAHAAVIAPSITSINGSTLNLTFQGAVAGSTYITFEDVTAGTPGTLTSGVGRFAGDGAVEIGTTSGQHATPAGDLTNYLSTGFDGSSGSKTETLTFDGGKAYNKFGLYWGSIDSYNTLTFYKGDSQIFSLMGSGVPDAVGNGDQASDPSNRYVNFDFGAASFDKVVFNSTSPAFEVDNLAVAGAVPELSTWAMMIIGFGGVGFQLRRRGNAAATTA